MLSQPEIISPPHQAHLLVLLLSLYGIAFGQLWSAVPSVCPLLASCVPSEKEVRKREDTQAETKMNAVR